MDLDGSVDDLSATEESADVYRRKIETSEAADGHVAAPAPVSVSSH